MNTTTLNIALLINNPSALTREQGALIYNRIVSCLNDGNKVILDFKDIESIITPFLNVSIGKLYENFSSAQLNNQLVLENIPEGTSSKFQMVIRNAKQYYSDKKTFNTAIEEVINNQ